MADDTDLPAANLCGMLTDFACTLYNQGMFGKGHTSGFCCCKPPGPRYKEYFVKMLKGRKEGREVGLL